VRHPPENYRCLTAAAGGFAASAIEEWRLGCLLVRRAFCVAGRREALLREYCLNFTVRGSNGRTQLVGSLSTHWSAKDLGRRINVRYAGFHGTTTATPTSLVSLSCCQSHRPDDAEWISSPHHRHHIQHMDRDLGLHRSLALLPGPATALRARSGRGLIRHWQHRCRRPLRDGLDRRTPVAGQAPHRGQN
jgi:hypothetical protein